MNKRRFVVFFMLPALAAITSCGSQDKVTVTTAQPVPVTVGLPSQAGVSSIQASGQVTASQTAAISTRLMGTITLLRVKVGDRVRKGQVLATISAEDIRARRAQTEAMIREAEANLAAVEKDHNRYVNLYRQESATAKEMDMMTLQLNAAKSRVQAAWQMKREVNAMLGYTTLTAPFNGVVTQKLAEEGGIASPGMPLLMIENAGAMEVSATVAESEIGRLQLNQSAMVTVKSTGHRFEGRLVQLNPSSQFSGAQYIIRISIPAAMQKELNAGMYVSVSIDAGKPEAASAQQAGITVPVSSIVRRDQLTGLYTIGENNTAVLRWVRLGREYGDRVEVLSGLGKDERFIISSDGKLVNGTKIKI